MLWRAASPAPSRPPPFSVRWPGSRQSTETYPQYGRRTSAGPPETSDLSADNSRAPAGPGRPGPAWQSPYARYWDRAWVQNQKARPPDGPAGGPLRPAIVANYRFGQC